MTDRDLRQRLAELIVAALEVGTSKHERDVIDEIFDAFNIDFSGLEARFSPRMRDRTGLLRRRAANRLAEAAPTATDLLNEFVRRGGRFVAMLDEIYARLARHTAAIAGPTETFRLERAGVAEEYLTISPAFIEQVRRLEQRLGALDIGMIDEAAVGSLLGWDGGELYGRWPVRDNDGFRLADAVLHLAWITPAVEQYASRDAAWAAVHPAVEATRASAQRLMTAAGKLVRAHAAHLDALSDIDAQTAVGQLFANKPAWGPGNAVAELEHFRATRMLGAVVDPFYVTGIEETSAIGLRDGLEPVAILATDRWSGTGISYLASFIAMGRLGLWAGRRRSTLQDQLFNSPAALMSWLDRVTACCDEASAWLADDVFTATRSVNAAELAELIEEFLNLPLWKQRDLLYEAWILCATLAACEQGGWITELRGLTHINGVWTLPVGPADDPVAALRRNADSAIFLDVWREPNRSTSAGKFTPDVTVSTPSPYVRDLLVIEAKDRRYMALGQVPGHAGTVPAGSGMQTALQVAHRYAAGLHPRATWVCNHCDFRQDIDAAVNHGDAWTHIHAAAQFRPGNVPVIFADSVRAALAPPQGEGVGSREVSAASRKSSLVLVVDVTASMGDHLNDAFAFLAEEPDWSSFEEFRAVLYSEHGDDEPFVVRKLGPVGDLLGLFRAIEALPSGNGRDREEALEDAMQRCRELADDIGPHDLLVLTDAPPHPVGDCPYRIDFKSETRALLKSGCRIHVVNDWLTAGDDTWADFQALPGFHLAPLREIRPKQISASGG
jgi:hypothetical protein